MQKRDIVQRFLESGLLVHPDVVNYISESGASGIIESIINSIPSGVSVVTPREVPRMAPHRTEKLDVGLAILPEILAGKEWSSEPLAEPEAVSRMFRNRYDTLAQMMKGRLTPYPIEALTRTGSRYADSDIGVIGIVNSSQTSGKGHRIVEIEDPTGTIKVLFNKNRDGFDEAEKILPDEVIGVKGKLAPAQPGGVSSGMIFADTLFRPDIPTTHIFSPPPGKPGKAVLISDVHVGSDTFLDDSWDRFTEWMHGNLDIQYLLIDGDVVDGIGVYPDQDKELHIKTIYEQYDRVGELLCELPKHLQIVLSPGNHDAVRGAEPQPALPEEFRKKFPSNVTFVENPSMVSIQSVSTLMYHGRSIDDLIKYIPGASYTKPGEIMVEMLKRRHLSPIYGQRCPLLSTELDNLVIRKVPDILHTGHVHISEVVNYKNVLCVNAGTWQSQTSFQRQMNIDPTPAEAVVVDLSTLASQRFAFRKEKDGDKRNPDVVYV